MSLWHVACNVIHSVNVRACVHAHSHDIGSPIVEMLRTIMLGNVRGRMNMIHYVLLTNTHSVNVRACVHAHASTCARVCSTRTVRIVDHGISVHA